MSDLNKAQYVVLQKLASYFKIPKTKLREYINVSELGYGGLRFDLSDDFESITLSEIFECIEGKFDLTEVMNPVKFEKSQIYQAYINKQPGCLLVFISTGGIWIITENEPDWEANYKIGTAGITVIPPYKNRLYIIPINLFLQMAHPLPSE